MAANITKAKPSDEAAERRAAERLSAKVPAVFSTSTASGVSALADQFSESGLFLGTESVCPLNSVLDIKIQIPGQTKPIAATARVVYTNPYRPYVKTVLPPGMGVKFTSILDEDRVRLLEFIREKLGQDRALIKMDQPLRSRPAPPEKEGKAAEEEEDLGASMMKKAFGDGGGKKDAEAKAKPRASREKPGQRTRGKPEPEAKEGGKSLWTKIWAVLTSNVSGEKKAGSKNAGKKPAGKTGKTKSSSR